MIHRLERLMLLLAVSLLTACAHAKQNASLMRCEMPPALQKEFDASFPSSGDDFPTARERESMQQKLNALVSREKEDVQIRSAAYAAWQRDGIMSPEMVKQELEAMVAANPDDAVARYLLANQYRNSPLQMITHLSRAAELIPDSPVIAQALAGVYARQPVFDQMKFQSLVQQVRRSCPQNLSVYSAYLNVPDKTLMAASAKELRAALANTKDAKLCPTYQTLWNLEFRSVEPTMHGPVRKAVSADLDYLQSKYSNDLACLRTIKSGSDLTGEVARATAATEKAIQQFPVSTYAADARAMRWSSTNLPPAQAASKSDQRAYAQRQYEFAQEELKRTPKNFTLLKLRLDAALALPDLSETEFTNAVNQFLDVFGGSNIPLFSTPGTYLKIAEAQLNRQSDSVVVWVKRGEVEEARRRAVVMANAGGNIFLKRDIEIAAHHDAVYGDTLLARYHLSRDELSSTKAALVSAKKKLTNFKEQPNDPPPAKSRIAQSEASLLRWEAELALKENRKDDAVKAFETALAKWPPDAPTDFSEEVKGRLSALKQQQEGATKPAGESRGLSKDISSSTIVPRFTLTSMDGQKITEAIFRGRKSLVNFWATWCGPCLLELPHVQRLHEEFAGNAGVQVITLNADPNPGVIEPFMERNRYSFKVIPLNGFTSTPFGNLNGLPLTWFVNAEGKVHKVTAGFSNRHNDFLIEARRFLGQ